MFHGVAHPVVAASALEAGVERYAALLGRPAEPRAEDEREATFRLAKADLVLRPADAGEVEGLAALHFAAADPGACADALAAQGVDVEPRTGGGGFDLPLSATRGLRLACVQVEPPAPQAPRSSARSEDPAPQALRSSARSVLSESVQGMWHRAESAEPGALAPPPKPSEVIELDHVVVASSDLEAARRLYADVLGLRLALDRSFEARGLRILFFRVGGVTVEVVGRSDAPRDAEAADRFGGLAWRVGDTDAARERVAAAGFDVSPVRPGAKPGTRVCTVRSGTCGVPTLLIGPGSAGPRAR